jgi:hypothetical protein
MPTAQPPEWCKVRIFPSWSNQWVPCNSTVNQAAGRCWQYNHPRKTEEADMAHPTTPPSAPGPQDECASCGHARWRHKEVDGQQVCTEHVDCACRGVFVEMTMSTRMARFVEAGQYVANAMTNVRTAMTEAFRALHGMHAAMQQAGLLPEEEPRLCDGCDRTNQTVTATDDGRALLCPDCMDAINNPTSAMERNAPALQQLATFHHVDCDKNCGGTCTTLPPQLATHLAQALDIPETAITGPSPDDLSFPDHWTQAAPVMGTHQVIPHAPGRGPIRYPQSDELQAAHHVGNSCATCWPRPCDPARSQCLRRPHPDTSQTQPPTGAGQ